MSTIKETSYNAPTPKISLPDIPALHLNAKTAYLLTTDGEIKTLPAAQAKSLLHKQAVLLCHAPYIRNRLGADTELFAFDLLELFAFVHPGTFATPTINGLCHALGLVPPSTHEDAPFTLMDITRALLSDLQNDPHSAKANPLDIANVMGLNGKGWGWTPFIFSALGAEYDPVIPINPKTGIDVWKHLPEWSDDAPPPPPSHHPVSVDEAQARLTKLLGHNAEKRDAQMDYTGRITEAFAPPKSADGASNTPNIVLAEAGTGVGKTLGYLAPASVWAEKNEGTVWISTYTKNLQRQIDQELNKLYPDTAIKDAHVATRKGRENYLCLLNLEEIANGAALAKHNNAAIASGIMARWVAASKDGDLTGGQYPGWLTSILGYQNSAGMADKRGECIYSACDHYHKCFVEHSVRAAKSARIVVANHALVMINTAIASSEDDVPNRYIFDEGHHLFDAADSAFAAHLTARETRDFRRWILGNEGGRRASRARGLKRRAEGLIEGEQDAEEYLRKILNAAECLPLDGWTHRLKDSMPSGPAEKFMASIYAQTTARAKGLDTPYSLETEIFPLEDSVIEAGKVLKSALKSLQKPMKDLSATLHKKLVDAADENGSYLDSDTRKRLEALSGALDRRATLTLGAWIAMLDNLEKQPDQPAPADFIDWFEIERIEGRAIDVGYYRHFVDPMKPFAQSLRPHLHGMAITSATLRDSEDWESARYRTGAYDLRALDHASPIDQIQAQVAAHITGQENAHEYSFDSPYNYGEQTKIFIVNDVNKNDIKQVASAYRDLFEASEGGALGLFTAISRLRAVHENISTYLEENAIPVYAQHADEIDPGTLVDMFKEDMRSCLLGTDAIRDGVDVPGDSLKLIAFDRVPWPRPTILHKARRNAYAKQHETPPRSYDEMVTRLKLKQAFGRLIRRGTDKGVFVMLDPMLPTRLQDAFPKDVEIIKTGLADVIQNIRNFL